MEPTSNNLGTQQPQNTAGMQGQSYTIRPRFYNRNRIRVRNANRPTGTIPNSAVSPVTAPSDADFYSEESTGAREITPTIDPVSDFRPVSPDAPASAPAAPKSKALGFILATLVALLAFAGGLVLGMNWDKLFAAKPAPATPETQKTVDIRDLTSSEIADLSKKINYLVMADTEPGFISMGVHRLLPGIINNTLSDADKLTITIYSLRDEIVLMGDCGPDADMDSCTSPATISAERAASRYYEIFGTNLVFAESAHCPSYSLSADKTTYTINETSCNGAVDNYDLLYKSEYYYKDGYAYVDIAVGSRFIGENGTIYNDYYTATDKTAVKTIADFASPEEFNAFQITADNAKDFTLYTLKFKASNASNYYFVGASKAEPKAEPAPEKPADDCGPSAQTDGEPAMNCDPADQPAEAPTNSPDAANGSDAPADASNTQNPADNAATDNPGDDISYETDPDAPPCPRSNPYARCVE